MAQRILPDGPFNLAQLDYGPLLGRIDPQDYNMKSTMPTDHTVIVGENLSGIAKLYGLSYDALYEMNRGTIEKAAHLHGHPDSDYGFRLYPGTTLKV